MLFENGSIIVDVRGKLGGQVYSKNRYGRFMCNTYRPVNPQTTFQQENRMYLARSVSAWKMLSEHERLSWNSAAIYLHGTNCFGDNFRYSAYNCYVKCSCVFLAINNITLGACPTIAIPQGFRGFNFTINTEEQLFKLEYSSPSQLNLYTFIYATRPLNAGRKPKKSDYRRIYFNGGVEPDDAIFTAAYVAFFGAFPEVGKVVHLKLCSVDPVNGLISPALVASATCSSYLVSLTPYNLNQASFNAGTGVLSLNAAIQAFAALHACDFTRPFSFSFRIITNLSTISLRLSFSSIDTVIPAADARNLYRWLYNPVTPAYVVNYLGAYIGGTMLSSINSYLTFAYNGSVMTIFEGDSPDNMVSRGSFTISFSGVSYITFVNASAVACQIDNLKFTQ